MNKYKKALIALARISFTTDETEYGDSVVRQVLYRQLRALGIIKFKNGDFIFEEKRKEHPDKDKGFLYIQSGKAAMANGNEVSEEVVKDVIKIIEGHND